MPDTATTPLSPKAKSSAKSTSAKRATGAGASKARASRTTAARSRGAAKGKPAGARTSARGSAARRGPAAGANSTRSTADLVGDYAERAVLIPVGAALLARERVASTVTDTISTYSTPSKAQSQLRKFEHRGSAARTRLEREVRKTRTRVERELRERRRELDRRRARLAKDVSSKVEQTQAQIEDVVRTRLEEGADFASRVQERVLNLV